MSIRGTSTGEGSTGEYKPEPVELGVPRLRGHGTGGLGDAPLMDHAEHNAAVRAGDIASVHSWELVTAMDGPGTRMTLFLSGCPLRCVYCHNPDTMEMRRGEPMLREDILKRVLRYAPIFKASGGGLTISGGEPLMQPAFLERLLADVHAKGIHTAIDTSGFLGRNASDAILDNLDLVLLDIKSGIPEVYEKLTGRQLQPTIDFAHKIASRGIEVWVRFVLVPGWTDSPENVEAVADIAASISTLTRVEVLPFHQMGRDKWESLNIPYELDDVEPPSREHTEWARDIFRSRGIETY